MNQTSEEARRVREFLFEDTARVEVFAEAIDRTPRHVQRLIAQGLPVVYQGKTPLVVISKAKDFLLKRLTHDQTPRRRGRPRKVVAN